MVREMLFIKEYTLLSFPSSRPPILKEVSFLWTERRKLKTFYDITVLVYGSTGAEETSGRWK